jgi:hypothetical protein
MEVEIRTDLPLKTKRERKHAETSEPHEAGRSLNDGALEPLNAHGEEKTSASAATPLIEVEVLRLPPNPRLVICRYRAFGEERRCTVWVGRNSKFVPRMKLWLTEPSDPVARVRPWAYAGPLPRRRGRW